MLTILSYTDRNLAKKQLNSVPTQKILLLYHSALKSTDNVLFHLQYCTITVSYLCQL